MLYLVAEMHILFFGWMMDGQEAHRVCRAVDEVVLLLLSPC
jgi:hypothetical protein